MTTLAHSAACIDGDEECDCESQQKFLKRPRGPLMICPTCDGEGKHSRGMEPAGGGFTQSEFQEAFGGWDDQHDCSEASLYFAGHYDESCHTCGGRGMVREDDEAAADRSNYQINMARGYNEAGEPMH